MGEACGRILKPKEVFSSNTLCGRRVRGATLGFRLLLGWRGGLLCTQFPQSFSIVQDKEIRLIDCFTKKNEAEGEWQIVVSRNLNDWEINEHFFFEIKIKYYYARGTKGVPLVYKIVTSQPNDPWLYQSLPNL